MQAFPLSPRSVNIRAKPKHEIKKEPKPVHDAAVRRIQKEKDHADPPPHLVVQSEGPNGIPKETFETGDLLGKGGFAICYQARLVGLKYKRIPEQSRLFALKIVKANFAQKRMQDKFRTELQIHSKMRHPNIVEFHRAFTFDNCTYVVLELCANGSVADMVRKRRCLSLPEVRRFTMQLCGAIKYMHARNVIHRDLKMGNIFIDRDMNLKIGDFGLAAVLISESDIKGFSNRRTTLCGTPNYIAPEILAKSKKGHDHKVDIWAVGVIVYAMLTGIPPFQAGSPDDIYKKVKCSTYSWPGEDQTGNDVSRIEARKDGRPYNDIPDEAKDLVASLLQIKADDRPDPDMIVVHPFFSMHKGKAIPKTLTHDCTLVKPSWLLRNNPQGDVVDQTFEHIFPKALGRECGVGHFPGDSEPVDIAGDDLAVPLYQECLLEEAEGRGPIIPLPQDMVYVSRTISKNWPCPENASGASHQQRVSRSSHNQQAAPFGTRRVHSYSRSHAADLRSQAGLGSSCTYGRAASGPGLEGYLAPRRVVAADEVNVAPKRIPSDSQPLIRRSPSRHASAPLQSARQSLITDLPVRSLHSTVTGGKIQSLTLPRHMSRTIRPTVTSGELDHVDLKLTKTGKGSLPRSTSTKPLEKGEKSNADDLLTDKKPSFPGIQSKVNIVAHAQEDLLGGLTGTHSSSQDSLPAQPRRVSPRSVCPTYDNSQSFSLFGPDEVVEILPNTRPRQVLRRLRSFHANLEADLKIDEGTSAAHISSRSIDSTSSLSVKDLDERPVVVQWVDYTNKFGIGYILRNGTVGCIFKADHGIQPSCVVVPGAETHLRKRKMTDYYDRNQIVPKHGAPVEFLENCGDEGIKRITKPAIAFQVETNAEGLSERWASTDDIYDCEKRRKLCLWDKFGKYMTQTLGKDDCRNQDSEEIDSKMKTRGKRASGPGPFIKFYQRLGNVGVWGFGNGSFQFNFPDHTKLVLSEDGTWIDFYHLPIEAAQALRKGDNLRAGALDERKVLSYTIPVMLCGHHGTDTFGQVIKANELRQKLEFVRDIVKTWIDNGGLGCMTSGTQRLNWTGLAERGDRNKKQKLLWVTVGAKGGDERFEQIIEGVTDCRL